MVNNICQELEAYANSERMEFNTSQRYTSNSTTTDKNRRTMWDENMFKMSIKVVAIFFFHKLIQIELCKPVYMYVHTYSCFLQPIKILFSQAIHTKWCLRIIFGTTNTVRTASVICPQPLYVQIRKDKNINENLTRCVHQSDSCN